MDGTALVYTHGLLDTPAAKTAHGLIRGTDRYDLKGLIDPRFAGREAGSILDGRDRGIPIFESLEAALQVAGSVDYLIMGIANAGGKLDSDWMPVIKAAIQSGMSPVCGMHQFLTEIPELVELAKAHQVKLIDVRRPKPRAELHFWSGEIYDVPCPIIPVIGTDCAVGKRTTARFLMEACREAGIHAQMIYTGQTGWLQGGQYGFVLDSVLNDFVSGELEHAILTCYAETKPDLIFIEGQSALRNPSGPCGAELLLSGHASGVILVHPGGRTYYKGWDFTGQKIPGPASEIALIQSYGVKTIGLAVNTKGMSLAEARDYQTQQSQTLGIPVALPVEDGVDPLLPPLQKLLQPTPN